METRNRCKACRFKRCLEQGMAMESVKMGRIPKKVKEKALKNYYKYQKQKSQQQQQIKDIDDAQLVYDDELEDFETDNYSLSSIKRESISSSSSYSSSSTSSVNIRQSIDSNQEIVIVPQSK
jgi:mannose-6-phosphate isomerase class I